MTFLEYKLQSKDICSKIIVLIIVFLCAGYIGYDENDDDDRSCPKYDYIWFTVTRETCPEIIFQKARSTLKLVNVFD